MVNYKPPVTLLSSQIVRDQRIIPDSAERVDDAGRYYFLSVYPGRGRFRVAFDEVQSVSTVVLTEIGMQRARHKQMFELAKHRSLGIGQVLPANALVFARRPTSPS